MDATSNSSNFIINGWISTYLNSESLLTPLDEVNTLKYLEQNRDWVSSNSEITKAFFNRCLQNKTLIANPLYRRVWSQYCKYLIPDQSITLLGSTQAVFIPRNLLSSTLASQLNFPKNGDENRVIIDIKGYLNSRKKPEDPISEEIIFSVEKNFFKFLEEKPIEFTSDNFLPLLQIADYYNCPGLAKLCLEEMKSALDPENFVEIYVACYENIHDLSIIKDFNRIFLQFFLDHPTTEYEYMPVAEKNQSEVKNDRALQTLKDVFEAKKLTCLAYFKAYSGNEQIIIIPRSNDQIDCIIKIVKFIKIEIVDLNYLPITFGESLKQADIEIPMHVSKFVPAFHKSFEMAKAYVDQFEKGPLKKLNLKIDELTDEQLNELIKEVPNIARLTIHSGKITSLSLPNVKKLSLYGCRFLKNLKAPLAKSVEILECGLLNDAKSPLAEMVKVYNCDSLASLEAPLAKSVEIQECNLLNYAKFPLAEMVKVYNCDSLANLEAPLAEMVKVYNCDSLASLEAPLAKFVDIKLCPNLIYKNSKMELEEN